MTGNNFVEFVTHNPALAPLGLRIEIEKKLREIATTHSVDSKNYSAVQLIDLLQQQVILSKDEAVVLKRLVNSMSRTVHQSPNDPRLTGWVIENGPYVIASLEKKISH